MFAILYDKKWPLKSKLVSSNFRKEKEFTKISEILTIIPERDLRQWLNNLGGEL